MFNVSVFLVALWVGVAVGAEPDTALLARGKSVYERACAVCHALDPPPKMAPTMPDIARQYRAAFSDSGPAIAHMVDFIKKPALEKSKLMASGHTPWPPMPPMPLPADDLKAVSYWTWQLEAPAPAPTSDAPRNPPP